MTDTTGRMGGAAAVAWAVVGLMALWSAAFDQGDDWEIAYTAFSIALLMATALTVALAAGATRVTTRATLRRVGLAVSVLGVAASVVAWAFPLWMSILGVGLGLLAMTSAAETRRPVALLAAGHLVGLAVMVAGLAAEVGRTDEWGDHPVPGNVGAAIAAAVTVAGLVMLADRHRHAAAAATG